MKVKYYDWNTVGRDFIVGDLHGCLDELYKLLDYIKFDFKNDRLFSVGDLVDRGKNSKECLSLIYAPWFYSVRANHEDMMFQGVLHNDDNQFDSWLYNGGHWYFAEDPIDLKETLKDIEDKFPLVIVLGNGSHKRVNIAHAEIYKNKDWDIATDLDIDHWNFDSFSEPNLMWGRTIIESAPLFQDKVNEGLSLTYCGHTPIKEPKEVFNHRFIDTGCVFGTTKLLEWAKLTIVNPISNEVYQLNSKTGEINEYVWE